jgi:trans-aconitate methyltransferase
MQIETAVDLIKEGVMSSSQQTWADLGAGQGMFTKALSTCLSAGSTIYAVDKDGAALRSITIEPTITLHTFQKDFVKDALDLPLDGILMANALHFVENQLAFIQRIRKNLKPAARMILVEYNTDHGNRWVPYPMSYATLQTFSREAGFASVEFLHEVPSAYQGSIYSALLR